MDDYEHKRTKATAYNLLTERVIEPIDRIIHALDRENPKIEVALYHLKEMQEHAQNNLKHFDE